MNIDSETFFILDMLGYVGYTLLMIGILGQRHILAELKEDWLANQSCRGNYMGRNFLPPWIILWGNFWRAVPLH